MHFLPVILKALDFDPLCLTSNIKATIACRTQKPSSFNTNRLMINKFKVDHFKSLCYVILHTHIFLLQTY